MFLGAVIRTTTGRAEFLTSSVSVRHLDTTSDGRNVQNIALLIDAWTCLLADSPLNSSSLCEKPFRLFHTFRKWLLSGPLLDKIKEYSSLADKIVQSTYLTGHDAYTGDFVDAMKDTPVFKEYLTWYRGGDASLLAYVLSFLWFGKKLDYEDPEMDATAFRGWLEVEERLSDLVLDPVVVSDLRQIMFELIGNYRFDPSWPKFGPGSVSEAGVRGNIRKSNSIRFSAKLDRLMFRSPQGLMRDYECDGDLAQKILPDKSAWDEASQLSMTTASLRFVPKDVSKSRSICMEPNTYMWAQQAVLRSLTSAFRSGLMSRFVCLEDQSRNRDMALFGSYTTEIDTIDLSSASDSVHVNLVRQIMPRKLWHSLLATRSRDVKVAGRDVRLVHKFAPMGSAVCFPVQCLIFTSVAILAALHEAEGMPEGLSLAVSRQRMSNLDLTIRDLFSERLGYHHWENRFQPLAVYGDDIAIDTRLTTRTVRLLNSLGFEVNLSKSFTGGQAFRESCGGYYWGGEDVTPLRFRVKRVVGGNPSSHVASVVALANRAGDRGYRNLRRLLVHWALETRRDVAFSEDPEAGLAIFSKNPRNTHLRRRYNSRYQRDEVRCATLLPSVRRKPRPFEKDAYERYLYEQWWASHRGGTATPDFTSGASRFSGEELPDLTAVPSRGDTSGTRLGWGWKPA